MTHSDLVLAALAIHGPLLGGAILAFYKYGDRTELLDKSMKGTGAVLRKMRLDITFELEQMLIGLIENSPSDPSLVVKSDRSIYVEQKVNPISSESFRETLQEFIETRSRSLAEYRSALLARDSWYSWARVLSWAILVFLVWEIITIAVIVFSEQILGPAVPDWLVRWSFLPTGVILLGCILPLPVLLYRHDRINKCRRDYYED